MPKLKRKFFVLDTNVILHDSSCIYNFKEHDVVIPIVVLEELDKFKKGSNEINYNAREFVRILDALSGEKLLNGGAQISSKHGKIVIHMGGKIHQECAIFSMAKPDHIILNTACCIKDENASAHVILVTKDVNLRMKAKAIGLIAQDYTSDHVSNDLYEGSRTLSGISKSSINDLYADNAIELQAVGDITANEFFILKSGKQSALAIFQDNMFFLLKKQRAFGISPRNAEQIFALHALCDPDILLVSLVGKAGTGKTLLALAASLQCEQNYRQIFMARPIVALSNNDIGYLPGEVGSKIGPYMQPLYDNLAVIKSGGIDLRKVELIEKMQEEKKLSIQPLAYVRGRSLVNMYMIIDEAQNLTPHEIKTIVTRAGEGTKIVFTGDIHQIDHPYLDERSNGLSYLVEKMRGQKVYAHITLQKGERSYLADLASGLL